MLKYQGKEYRNLEEQVQKNKEDIARHYEIDRALANLGIKIVGTVLTPAELPDPYTYVGEYGDTYAVGNPDEVEAGTSSYVYYVWTRPDPDAGEPNNHWLNVGRLSIVGPRGPEGPIGPEGPKGERGSRWTVGESPGISDPKVGDIWLLTSSNQDITGTVYTYNGNTWVPGRSIRGPQGIQGQVGPTGPAGPEGPAGPIGPAGDVGGFINIWGILNSATQLPNPATLSNLTVAYLVGADKPYDLYIQVGETSATAIWENTGPFNAATVVTVRGAFQNVWSADSKLDKSEHETSYDQAYVKDYEGSQTLINISTSIVGSAIVRRIYNGDILVNTTDSSSSNAAVSKGYAEAKFAPKTPTTTGNYRIWRSNKTSSDWIIVQSTQETAQKGNIPIYITNDDWGDYDPIGRLLMSTPLKPYQGANKHYVDEKGVVSGYFSFTSSSGGVGRAYHVMPIKYYDMINEGTLEIYEYFISILDATSFGTGIPACIETSSWTGALIYDPGSDQFQYKTSPSTSIGVELSEFVAIYSA